MKEKPSSLGLTLTNKKYTSWIIASFLFFILIVSVPAGFVYASSLDTMMPSDTQSDAIYNRYGVSQYSFQTVSEDHHFWEVGAVAKDGIVGAYDSMLSAAFLAIVQICRFFNFVARQAFSFGVMNDLIDGVAEMVKEVTGVHSGLITSGGLVDGIGGMAIMITVAYILWLMVRTRFLDGMQQALSFLIALVIILGFFSNAGAFLKIANNMVDSTGSIVFAPLAKATGLNSNSTNGIVLISEEVWNSLVIRPYTMLQFDSADVSTKDPTLLDNVLKTKPFSEEREAALVAASNKYPAVAEVRSAEQIILIIVYFIFSLIILGLLTYWSITTIFMRFKLLIQGAVMSVTLLAALLPGREAGVAVLRSQFIKLVGTAMSTFMAIFIMDLSLVMGHFTYDVTFKASNNWFLSLFLEAIMVFSIFKYRNEITQVFGKATGIPAQIPKAKNTIVDALQRNVTRSLYNSASNKVSGLFHRKEREGVPASFSPSALGRASTNLNDATSSSMMLRYQREKEAAESLATEEGQEVHYTPYVQRVNENLRNGAKNPFRGMDKEWKEEKHRLQQVQDDHGDMKQAILTQGIQEGMNDQEAAAMVYSNEHAIRKAATYMVERPKRVDEQMARVRSLNRNNQLKTSVDDFCMIQLFDRYKVDYKKAIDASNVTGEPVNHSDFVKNMDAHFAEAGLTNTMKVNNAMLHRNSRIAIAPVFEEMAEFKQMKMKLLHANEALRRVTPPTEGVEIPLPVHLTAPVDTAYAIGQMPKLPAADITSQMQERAALLRKPLMPAEAPAKVLHMPDSYMRKPKANLEKDGAVGTPAVRMQPLPYATEAIQAALPNLPTASITSQLKQQRQELNQQVLQALPVQTPTAQVIPAPLIAFTGPVQSNVVQKQLPALSSGGIRQQLAEQRNSMVRQALMASSEAGSAEHVLINGPRLQVEQKGGEHSFSSIERGAKTPMVRSEIDKETTVRSRFKMLEAPARALQSQEGSQKPSSFIQKVSYTLQKDVRAVNTGSEHLFGMDQKQNLQPSAVHTVHQRDTEVRSRFKVLNTPQRAKDLTFGEQLPAQQSRTVQFTIQKAFKTANIGALPKEDLAPAQRTQKLQLTQQTELKRLNPAVLNAKMNDTEEILAHSDVRITAKRRISAQIPKSPLLPAELQSGIKAAGKTVNQEQLQQLRVNRNEHTKVDLNRVRIQSPELKLIMDNRDTAFPELASAPKQISKQKLQQDTHRQVTVGQHHVTQVESEKTRVTRTGAASPSKTLPGALNLTSSLQQTHQSIQQDQQHRVNVARHKQVSLNTKSVQFMDSGMKAMMDKGQEALQLARTTSSVTAQSIKASQLYKVNVSREAGLKVNITDPAALPKIDSLLGVKDNTKQSIKQTATRDVNVERNQITKLGIKSVNIKNADLKFKMEQANTVVHQSVNEIISKPEIKTSVNIDKALKVKEKVSVSLSDGLEDELKHLKTMERARKVAPVTSAADSVSKLIQSKAKAARQQSTNQRSGEPS